MWILGLKGLTKASSIQRKVNLSERLFENNLRLSPSVEQR